MKRFFVDANVLLDAVLGRPGHVTDALALLAMGATGKVVLLTTSNSIGVVLYQLQRSDAAKRGPRLQLAQRILTDLLDCVEVVPMLSDHFLQSASSGFGDIEDGAQYFAVTAHSGIDAVVSRDPDYDGHIGVKRLSAAAAMRLAKR